ncbi:MAG: cell division protein FtsQ/DivIB, partial [Vulcanimicrobiaceae bacterium]
IDVVGAHVVTRQAVIARAHIDPTANVWLLDLAPVRRRIEALPYVATVRVHRSFPAQVAIDVTERTPDGCLRRSDGSTATIDRTDRVLDANCITTSLPQYDPKHVVVGAVGTFVTDPRLRRLQRESHELAHPESFTRFWFDRFGGFEASLPSGVTIRFGADGEIAEKEALIAPILQAQGRPLRSVLALDLRIAAEPVVVYRDASITRTAKPQHIQDLGGANHNI